MKGPRRRWAAALVLATALLLAPAAASASPLSIYGFWPRDVAMAGAVAASDAGPGAAWQSPAAPAFAESQMVALGVSVFLPRLSIDRALAPCTADPATCAQLYPSGWSPVESLLPKNAVGFMLGWLKPLGGFFKRRVALSATMYLPAQNLLGAEGVDSATPHFLLYQDLTDKFTLAFSVSGRPLEWLSLGFGLQLLTDVGASITLDADVLGGGFARDDVNVYVEPKFGTVAGLMAKPGGGWTVAAAYHQELPLIFWIPTQIDLGGIAELDLYIEGTVLFSPHQFDFSVSKELPGWDLEVCAQASLALWSRMLDVAPRIDLDVKGELLEGTGAGDALDVRELDSRPRLGLKDTWTFHLGAEWRPTAAWRLRGGYQLRPSPMPRAREEGSTNLLDNDAHGVGLGAGVVFADPFGMHKAPLHVDVGLSMLMLSRRTIYKHEADPVGDLSHGGVVIGVLASVSHAY